MADRYAVGTGNWNDTSTWSDSSGGTTGQSVPVDGDDVIFDGNSGTVTLNAAARCDTITLNGGGTLDTDSSNDYALTVDEQMYLASAGTFNANGSTVKIGDGVTSSLYTLKVTNGTFNGGDGLHTIGCIHVNGGTCNLSQGTTTINGAETSSSAGIMQVNSGTLAHSNGTVIFDVQNYSNSIILLYGADITLYNVYLDATTSAQKLQLWGAGATSPRRKFTVANNLFIRGGRFLTQYSSIEEVDLDVTGNISVIPSASAGTDIKSELSTFGSVVNVGGTLTSQGTWNSGGSNYTPKALLDLGSGAQEYNAVSLLTGGDVTMSSGVTTIDGAGTAFRFDIQNGYNTYSNGSGTIKFTSSSDQTLYSSAQAADDFTQFHNLILEKTSSTLQGLTTVGFHIKVGAALTITSGILNTNTTNGTNHALTVSGYSEIGPASGSADQATLTCNASAITLGSGLTTQYGVIINQGGTFAGGTGVHILGGIKVADHAAAKFTCTSGNTTINGEHASDNYNVIVYDGATFDNADGTIILTGPSSIFYMQSSATVQAGEPRAHSLTINSAGNTFDLGHNLTVEGNLLITAGTLDTTALSNRALTVGTLGAAGQTGVIVDGTLTLNGSTCILTNLAGTGTLNAPTTTIIIRDRAEAGTYAGKAIDVDNMTVNNDLKIELTSGKAQDLDLGDDKIHDLTINNDTDARQNYMVQSGSIDGDLTITRGILNTFNRVLTVDGNCSIAADGKLEANVNGNVAVNLGSLTIASGGEYDATSATTTINGSFDNNGTDPTTSFIHNNGTILIEPQAASGIAIYGSNTGTGTVFYNLTCGASETVNIVGLEEKMVIENHWDNNAKARPSGEIRFGKATATTVAEGGSVNTGARLQLYGGHFIGLSTIYPVVFTGDGIDYETSSAFELSNIDWSAFSYTTSNNITLNLTGDCKFGALTISSGATLDLNGQRAEFSGAFDLTTGALAMNDAMAVFTNTIDFNGRVPTSNTGTTIIHDPPSAGEKLITSLYFGGTFFAKGVESDVNGYAWGGSSGEYPAKIFVGGQLDCQQSVKTGHWQLATGGELRGNDRTLTAEGDLTMSGGLIGKSALDFDAGSSAYVDLDNNAAWQFGTNNFTLEAWFRSDTNTGLNRTIIANGDASDNGFLLYMQGGGNIKFFINNIAVANAAGPYEDDDKWHHVAAVRDGNDYLLYIDGKLMDKSTQSAQDLTHAGKASIGARDLSASADAFFDGQIGMVRVFKGASGGARTQSEIRTDMFNDSANLADSTDLMCAYDFNEGSGTSLDNIQGNTNFDGTITNATWVGAGTFVDGTSTIDFTGNGSWYISDTATEYYKVNVAASGKTTTMEAVGANDKRPVIMNLLTHGGGTLTDVNNCSMTIKGTVTSGADLSNLYFTRWQSSTAVPELTTKYLTFNQNCDFAGDQTATQYVLFHYAHNLFDYNITTGRIVSYTSSSFTMGAGTITFTSTTGWGPNVYDDRSFSAGPGATIKGVGDKSGFASGNNWSVVGKIENLDVTNEELSVLGNVTNCTGDIHRWNPTIDTEQMLDADTADDRDVRLGSDLDRNTELVT